MERTEAKCLDITMKCF